MLKALILAAGRGSRMREMTDEKPKCMVIYKNKPLIKWQIDALKESGINDIAAVVGYKKEIIQSQKEILKFFENKEWASTNMVSSLFYADEWLSEGDCIISYSDIFYKTIIVKKLQAAKSDIAITYDANFAELWKSRFSDPLSDVESFKIDEMEFITEIGHRVGNIKEVQGQFMGLLKFTKKGWEIIKNSLSTYDIAKLDCTKMLQILIEKGIKIEGIRVEEIWGEIDNPQDLELYEKLY